MLVYLCSALLISFEIDFCEICEHKYMGNSVVELAKVNNEN